MKQWHVEMLSIYSNPLLYFPIIEVLTYLKFPFSTFEKVQFDLKLNRINIYHTWQSINLLIVGYVSPLLASILFICCHIIQRMNFLHPHIFLKGSDTLYKLYLLTCLNIGHEHFPTFWLNDTTIVFSLNIHEFWHALFCTFYSLPHFHRNRHKRIFNYCVPH